MKCKEKVEIIDPIESLTKNKRSITKGKCSICKGKVALLGSAKPIVSPNFALSPSGAED
jgi:hypothetical protein